jgi:transcriptional regulator with XRE-family HTH domain
MEINFERLRKLWKDKVVSMRELEELAGVSYNTIWRLETGRQGGASEDDTKTGRGSKCGATRTR